MYPTQCQTEKAHKYIKVSLALQYSKNENEHNNLDYGHYRRSGHQSQETSELTEELQERISRSLHQMEFDHRVDHELEHRLRLTQTRWVEVKIGVHVVNGTFAIGHALVSAVVDF